MSYFDIDYIYMLALDEQELKVFLWDEREREREKERDVLNETMV